MKMSVELLNEIKDLAAAITAAPTKSETQKDVRRLEFIHTQLKGEINGYVSGKLGKVVIDAKEASGQVSNKDHRISNMKESLYVFEREIASYLDQPPHS